MSDDVFLDFDYARNSEDIKISNCKEDKICIALY